MTKRIFISADHGMAIIYFLQSDVVSTLLTAGIEVIVLTDDETKEKIAQRFAQPNLIFEDLRLKQANDYARKVNPRLQSLLIYQNCPFGHHPCFACDGRDDFIAI